MRRCRRGILLYILCGLGLAPAAAAQVFDVGFYDYPPMMIRLARA